MIVLIRSCTERDQKYIVESHFRIYQEEYYFDDSFNIFISESIHNFMKNRNEEKENVWVIDSNGLLKGSIGIVKVSDDIAQLRWFLIEPDQRGRGLGKRLIQKAIEFSKDKNYKTIILWTNTSLYAARKLYESFGFNITEVKNSLLSNQEMVEEKWELKI
ncbi:MAG: GNAT family N-acetyltransferase [Paenibacillus sp.]|nr:GNAT family N-acetyltransferase [Paenibacillus sp.]